MHRARREVYDTHCVDRRSEVWRLWTYQWVPALVGQELGCAILLYRRVALSIDRVWWRLPVDRGRPSIGRDRKTSPAWGSVIGGTRMFGEAQVGLLDLGALGISAAGGRYCVP